MPGHREGGVWACQANWASGCVNVPQGTGHLDAQKEGGYNKDKLEPYFCFVIKVRRSVVSTSTYDGLQFVRGSRKTKLKLLSCKSSSLDGRSPPGERTLSFRTSSWLARPPSLVGSFEGEWLGGSIQVLLALHVALPVQHNSVHILR